MKAVQWVSAALCLGLGACEQVVLQGPVGDANIEISELRSGNVVGEGSSDGEAAVIARVGQATYDGYTDAQKLASYGLGAFPAPVALTPATLYLLTVSGGNEYDIDGDKIVDGPTPVQANIHAILTGAAFSGKQYAISALTETAYQVVVDHIDFMTDAEVQATLDEVARAMVNDTDSSGSVNYADLVRVNYIYADPATQVIASKRGDLADVSAAVSSALNVQNTALAMFAADNDTALAETVYEASVGPILEASGCASSSCHAPGGAGDLLSENVLLPSSNPNHVSANTDNFKLIVESEGVQYVVNKVAGSISHTGANTVTIANSSDEGQAFEAWLRLL